MVRFRINFRLPFLPLLPFAPLPPKETWPLIAISVAVHWFYQFCAIRALHRGALSLVFPVMRGLGPLATAVLAALGIFQNGQRAALEAFSD